MALFERLLARRQRVSRRVRKLWSHSLRGQEQLHLSRCGGVGLLLFSTLTQTRRHPSAKSRGAYPTYGRAASPVLANRARERSRPDVLVLLLAPVPRTSNIVLEPAPARPPSHYAVT